MPAILGAPDLPPTTDAATIDLFDALVETVQRLVAAYRVQHARTQPHPALQPNVVVSPVEQAAARLHEAWKAYAPPPTPLVERPYYPDPRCWCGCPHAAERQRQDPEHPRLLCNVHAPNLHHAKALEDATRDLQREREKLQALEATVENYRKLAKEGASVPPPGSNWKPSAG